MYLNPYRETEFICGKTLIRFGPAGFSVHDAISNKLKSRGIFKNMIGEENEYFRVEYHNELIKVYILKGQFKNQGFAVQPRRKN